MEITKIESLRNNGTDEVIDIKSIKGLSQFWFDNEKIYLVIRNYDDGNYEIDMTVFGGVKNLGVTHFSQRTPISVVDLTGLENDKEVSK